MRLKKIYLIIIVSLIATFFFPFVWTEHPDGTLEYSAVAVKYVNWAISSDMGTDLGNIETFKVYFFPKNYTDFEELKAEYYFG